MSITNNIAKQQVRILSLQHFQYYVTDTCHHCILILLLGIEYLLQNQSFLNTYLSTNCSSIKLSAVILCPIDRFLY